MNRMTTLVWVALGLNAAPVLAAYPEKPIRIVIPFAPGASADNYARLVGGRLTESDRRINPAAKSERPAGAPQFLA